MPVVVVVIVVVIVVAIFSSFIYVTRPVKDWLLLCETENGPCFAYALLKGSGFDYDRPRVFVTYRKRWYDKDVGEFDIERKRSYIFTIPATAVTHEKGA